MKINENLYKCEWCNFEFQWNKMNNTSTAEFNSIKNQPGRHKVVNQCICPKCSRYVKQ